MARRGPSESYALGEGDINSLWRACQELDDKALVGLLLFEGMRVSEATHLKADWVRQGEIHIPTKMECSCWTCSDRGYFQPKSKASARVIPIVETLLPHLLTFLQYKPGGLGYSRIYAWKRIKYLGEQAGVSYVTPHTLRATFATSLAKSGASAVTICYLLGWASLIIGQHYINIAKAKEEGTALMRRMFISA